MKVSVECYTPVDLFGEEVGLRMIRQAGFDAVDYSFYYHATACLTEDYLQRAAHTKALLQEIGLPCNQAHAPFSFKYGMTMDSSCPEYVEICRSIEYAAILGADHIILHSVKVPEGVDFVEYNISYYRSFTDLCRRTGIKVAVENLFSNPSGQPEILNAILAQLDPQYFVCCIDVGHCVLSGFAPEDFIPQVLPGRIHCLHIHDNNGVKDDHTLPYLGSIHWEQTMAALKTYGYQDELTLEILKYLNFFPDALVPAALQMCCNAGKYLTQLAE